MKNIFIGLVLFLFSGLSVQAQVRTTWYAGGQQKASEGMISGADPAVFNAGFDLLPKDVQAAKLSRAVKQGKWTYWFENGKLSAEEEYVNGKMTGVWRSYLPTGTKVFEIDFGSGKALYFHPDGTLESEGQMLPGMLQNGNWKGYYQNGNLNYTGSFLHGKKDGSWIFYDESGKKFMEQTYVSGVLQGSKKF